MVTPNRRKFYLVLNFPFEMRLPLVILSLGLLLASCSEFLQEEPRSLITKEQFFTEASSAQSAIDAIYSHLDADGVYANLGSPTPMSVHWVRPWASDPRMKS